MSIVLRHVAKSASSDSSCQNQKQKLIKALGSLRKTDRAPYLKIRIKHKPVSKPKKSSMICLYALVGSLLDEKICLIRRERKFDVAVKASGKK